MKAPDVSAISPRPRTSIPDHVQSSIPHMGVRKEGHHMPIVNQGGSFGYISVSTGEGCWLHFEGSKFGQNHCCLFPWSKQNSQNSQNSDIPFIWSLVEIVPAITSEMSMAAMAYFCFLLQMLTGPILATKSVRWQTPRSNSLSDCLLKIFPRQQPTLRLEETELTSSMVEKVSTYFNPSRGQSEPSCTDHIFGLANVTIHSKQFQFSCSKLDIFQHSSSDQQPKSQGQPPRRGPSKL